VRTKSILAIIGIRHFPILISCDWLNGEIATGHIQEAHADFDHRVTRPDKVGVVPGFTDYVK